MIDGIIKADGTSRLIRANLPATYEEFRAMAAAGTLPLDVLFNAAGWSQQPTFLNKANLLNDSTAALFGLDENAVPDEVFAFLGQYNQHWWRRRPYEKAVIVDDAIKLRIYYDTSNNDMVELSYSDSYTYNLDAGTISLATPTTEISYSSFYASRLDPVLGKYFKYNNVVYLAGDSYDIGENVEEYEYIYIDARKVHVDYLDSEWEYIQATAENAYPTGIAGEYLYEYLGVPLSNAVNVPKVASGFYIGTGMAGVDSPTTLSFDFAPKIVFLSHVDDLYFKFNDPGRPNYYMMISGVTKAYVDRSAGNVSATWLLITWDGNTVSWYHEPNTGSTVNYVPYAESQFNALNKKYLYVAIG